MVREIRQPFRGVGILTPEITSPPSQFVLTDLTARFRIASNDWMFLDFDTWAGSIDAVYAVGVRDQIQFGPLESEDARAEETYLLAMSKFGVDRMDALNCEIFERGVWGSC